LVDKARRELAKSREQQTGKPAMDESGEKNASGNKESPPQGPDGGQPEPLAAPPAWVPAVAGAEWDGRGAKRVDGGLEGGKIRGVSGDDPDSVAGAWIAAGKAAFTSSRRSTTTDELASETVMLKAKDDPKRWVELRAERAPGSKATTLRMRYASPVP
jgi:hypothetical protein